MINEMYKDMTGKGSVIREFFTYANKKLPKSEQKTFLTFPSATHLYRFRRNSQII